MGLQQELDCRPKRPNPVQRALQHVGASKAGAKLFQRTLFHLDRPIYRWTRGRASVPGIAIGIPVAMLTTTGAKSGLPRTMPVCVVPMDDDLVILGTNFGQEHTPGWVFNLLADPTGTLTWRDRSVDVRARLLEPEEMPRAWDEAAEVYIGFPRYRERTDGQRQVRGFLLQPA